MKKVMRLVSVQVWAMIAGMLSIGDYRKKKKGALYAGFAGFIAVISAASFVYSYLFGSSLKAFNSIESLPSLFMAITSVVVLFTTIYKVKGTIFGFKDFDLVMSLPVSNSKIIASRLMLLYIINQFFVLIIMVPMTVAYGILARPGFMFYLYSLLTVFFIPLIPVIIASFIGTIFAFISARIKHSNIIYMVFIFLFFLAWIIMPFFIQDSEEAIVEAGKALAGQINTIYPLAGLYSRAVAGTDFISMIIFVGISMAAFLIFSWGVGRVFVKINTAVFTERSKANYKMGDLKSSSPLKALYIKELRRYFASTVYVLNTGFGMVILLVFSIALPFINLDAMAGEMQITGMIQDYVPLFVTFCMAVSCTTMASVSIEGKNLWIVKSLPVSTSMIFASKMLVNLTVLAPAVLSSVLLGIALKLPFISGLLTVIGAVSFAFFVSAFGLAVNLSFPNLSWPNETVIVKQSTSSMISIFSSFGLVALQYGLLTLTGNSRLSLIIFICLIWVLNFVLYKRLAGKGKEQFRKL